VSYRASLHCLNNHKYEAGYVKQTSTQLFYIILNIENVQLFLMYQERFFLVTVNVK